MCSITQLSIFKALFSKNDFKLWEPSDTDSGTGSYRFIIMIIITFWCLLIKRLYIFQFFGCSCWHENASRINYVDLDLCSRSHIFIMKI